MKNINRKMNYSFLVTYISGSIESIGDFVAYDMVFPSNVQESWGCAPGLPTGLGSPMWGPEYEMLIRPWSIRTTMPSGHCPSVSMAMTCLVWRSCDTKVWTWNPSTCKIFVPDLFASSLAQPVEIFVKFQEKALWADLSSFVLLFLFLWCGELDKVP